MLPWLIGGLLIVTVFVVFVIRDARADDKRRKLARKPNYSDY